MEFRPIKKEDDSIIAALIRSTLKGYSLDIPGTAYFDEGLDHLSDYYATGDKGYYVLCDDSKKVIGGIGFERFLPMDDTAELQKLYLSKDTHGAGIGYEMIAFIEEKIRSLGYKRAYLETHDSLKSAIHIYEKCGYKEIERPKEVIHGTMNRFYLKDLM